MSSSGTPRRKQTTAINVDRDNARYRTIVHNQVNDVIFIEEIHVVLDALLVKRLQDHMSGAVSSMTCTADRFACLVVDVPAKAALRDFAILSAIKRQAHML